MMKGKTRRTKQAVGRRVLRGGRFGAWVRRYRWWLAGALVLATEVLLQVCYPPRYTLPFARYHNEWYGVKHRNGLAIKEQQAFAAAKVRLRASVGEKEVSLAALGASLREADSFAALHTYPLHWRLVPFSVLWQWPRVASLPVSFDEAALTQFVAAFAKESHRPPSNAALQLRDGQVIATPAVVGKTVDQAALRAAIERAQYGAAATATIVAPERDIAPAATADDLTKVRQQAESALAKRLQIIVAERDEVFTPSREQVASWLQIADVDGQTTLQLQAPAVERYVAELNKKVARQAGETVVTMLDGREESRQDGAAGEQFDAAAFASQLRAALFEGGQSAEVQLRLVAVPPAIKVVQRYTNSQAGLQAKLQEIGRRYNVRISLRQLDGAGWQASYRGDESTPSASTYKLYIALRLFEEIAAGRTSWQASMLDTSVAGCFDRMILHSTNQCAEAWINQFGRRQLNEFVHQRGISMVTTFTSWDATRTSANDLVRVLAGVQSGTLVNGPHRDKLLDMLRRQIWRTGIPVGTKGWTSNKVGFLWDYVHDAGIVHHPRGTYVVAVMTKGASYGIIAQIIRELEALMYP